MAKRSEIETWVDETARLTLPDSVVWCDGSEAERERLTALAVRTGVLEPLDPRRHPGSFLHRSAPNDVARTENLTYICTAKKDDAGPTNNWMAPKAAYARLTGILRGSMKGRTMYVIPFLMGPAGSPASHVGVQITDSLYVVLNMRIMTRMGTVALEALKTAPGFTRCLHGLADLDIRKRLICHFPEENAVWSVGSGYGGNALLGKKCLALRIGSWLGRSEGWMAEHMLIVGVESPAGKTDYIAAAFPSACGKTNLAMLIPPKAFPGYKVWTVGDDIAWIRPGPDGRLWAVNPEAGFFGVAPGTSRKTNPNAMETIARNTIFTNVLKTESGGVWWEGMDDAPPARGTDWQGKPWTPASKEKGAHPNARFTAPAAQCPSISPRWEDPQGVPLSAILFGGRRAKLAPLIFEAFDWNHGVYVGSAMASETTAAAAGQVGVVRRDPMAMLPFCGYNMGDYFGHWLAMGKRVKSPPKIFHVNWFRKGADGAFLWPGYGENLRPLLWAIDRCHGKGEARSTPIGLVPTEKALNLAGLDVPAGRLDALLSVDADDWRADTADHGKFLAGFGKRVPKGIRDQYAALLARLDKVSAPAPSAGGATKARKKAGSRTAKS